MSENHKNDPLVQSSERLRHQVLEMGRRVPWEVKNTVEWQDLEYAAEELLMNLRGRASRLSFLRLPNDLNKTDKKYPQITDLSEDELIEVACDLISERHNTVRILKHWDDLQKFLNENEGAKKEWDRFMMLMKLSGGDQKEEKK